MASWHHTCRAGLLFLLIWGLLSGPAGAEDPLGKAFALRHDDPKGGLAILNAELGQSADHADSGTLYEMLSLRASILRDLGRVDEAMRDVERIGALAASIPDSTMAANGARLLGTLYAEKGDIASALEAFHNARSLLSGTPAVEEMATVTSNIGTAYAFIQDHEQAKKYFDEALVLARQAGAESVELRVLSNLALAVSRIEGSEAGLPYQREALALARAREDAEITAYQLVGICTSLIDIGQLDEADDICRRASTRIAQIGHVRPQAEMQLSLGNLHLARDQRTQALSRYETALDIAQDSVPTIALRALERLASIHEDLGDHATALAHYRRKAALREEMLDEERRGMMEELHVRYQVSERERRISHLQMEATVKSLQLQRRNWVLLGLGFTLVLLLSLMLVTWHGYQTKSRLEQRLAARNRELEQAVATIGRLAREDPLTGLLNRRAFLELARHEQARARRDGASLSVVAVDIDNFKIVNDRHGHQVGDTVLAEVASRLRTSVREVDVVCRWGGEEFMLLLPGNDSSGAFVAVERLRESMASRPVDTAAGPVSVTATFGIAVVGMDLDRAMNAADQALYAGKRGGRNRTVIAGNAEDRNNTR